MSLKIRLKRAGNRKRPFYRVVVMESKNARDSRSVEDLGYYDPLESPTVFNVNRERAAYWIESGAQMSDTVDALMKSENSVHTSRRNLPSFTADAPEVRRPKKGEEGDRGKGKRPARAAKAESAVAVAEPPAAEEAPVAEATEAPAVAEAPEAPAAEAPAADAAPAEGDEKTEG